MSLSRTAPGGHRAAVPCVLALVAAFASCSGSGASDAAFELVHVSVQPDQVWQINRPIDLAFSADIDFATVSANTIHLSDSSGRPATGSFTSTGPRSVRLQPACPTRADLSDAGLAPGGVFYTLSIRAGAGATVRSSAGRPLARGRSVTFRTPPGTEPQEIFLDAVPGPPAVRLRGRDGVARDELRAAYLELGGDPDQRVYFELSPDQLGELRDADGNLFPVPLNHYSIPDNRVVVVLFLNQPVDASQENISSGRVRIEYLDRRIPGPVESWVPVATQVELEANCTETGAVLRLSPVGVLPQGAPLRVNLRASFEDIAGNFSPGDRGNFARMQTMLVDNPGSASPQSDADEVLENFLVGGRLEGSLEDRDAPLALPRAEWGAGGLTAGFAFTGTGGVAGPFDWIVDPGVQVMFNTISQQITGGDGANTGFQLTVGGLIDVRNVVIPAGSRVVFVGPNPVTLLASGSVTIAGELILSGSDSQGVGTLGTANVPEPGALGQAGGGAGGEASFLTAQSTPRGGHGFGAFGRANQGGLGGESSFHPDGSEKNARRAAGGGGGRLGPDVLYPLRAAGEAHFVQCQTLIGMDAEPGFDGGPDGTGAISQNARAQGGAMGVRPFVDGDEANDFYGSKLVHPGQSGERLVRGELQRTWAGAGGGAGGDAVISSSFPRVPFTPGGDEKGSGGGGGGGSLTILAIGDIIVEDGGRVVADGGRGGGGENTSFLDRVGGGSGGGSGGHIVFSSANRISIHVSESSLPHTGPFYGDPGLPGMLELEHPRRPLSALGGQGGVGRDNMGGAKAAGPTRWSCDGIPFARLALNLPGGETLSVPPLADDCFEALGGDPLGSVAGAGGDGGPGLIQLHVDSPAENLRFPGQQTMGEVYGVDLDVTRAMAPPPVGWRDLGDVDYLLPFFGSRSIAQSKWIRLGLGRLRPDLSGVPGDFLRDEQVLLRFAGTDAAGRVQREGQQVIPLPPVIGPDALASSPTPPYVDPTSGGATMVLDASGLVGVNEVFKRNAALNRRLLLRLADAADDEHEQLFEVQSAAYAADLDRLRVTVSTSDGTLEDFVAAGAVQVSYLPAFLRVETGGVADRLPELAEIQVTFDATTQDSSGLPNPELAYSARPDGAGGELGFTPRISDLNAQNWDFVRFRVLFDLNTDPNAEVDLSTPRPTVEFLRIQLDY